MMTADDGTDRPGQFDLTLLESLVRILKSEMADFGGKLLDLQIEPLDRLLSKKDLLEVEPIPAEIQEDVDLLVKLNGMSKAIGSIERDADCLLRRARQLWQTVEFVSGNVHKISFGARARFGEAAPQHVITVQDLLELALQLVQQTKELQNTFFSLKPRSQGRYLTVGFTDSSVAKSSDQRQICAMRR